MSVAEKPNAETLSYVGFWLRFWANIIDSFLVAIIIYPVLFVVYGLDYLTSDDIIKGPVDVVLNFVFPLVWTMMFWMFKQATPGKMAIGARVVDARTGGKPSFGQFTGRYFAYVLSFLGLTLGYLWVAFDPRKQGWHDKLASTVVVRAARPGPEPVTFTDTGPRA